MVGKISLILPVYNEVAILQQVLEKYIEDLKKTNVTFEIIAVNDGSTDGSEDILAEYARTHRNLKVVTLDGRWGKQAAINAGMDVIDSVSEAVILADIDILNPVGVLGRIIRRIGKGEKIVYAVRENFGFDKVRAFVSNVWTSFGAVMFGLDGKYAGKANISAFARDVVDVITTLPTYNKYLRTMVPWVGWEVNYLSYASGYNKTEERNIITAAKQEAERTPHTRGHKPTKRDTVREHTASLDLVWGFIAMAAIMMAFGIIYVTVLQGPSWVSLIIWLSFATLLLLTFILYTKAILVKRVGVIHKSGTTRIYEIKSTIN